MDEILSYLLKDLRALKACSLTCKCLFGATRPLIHRRLICLDTRPSFPERLLSGRRRRDPRTFERLVNAGRSGVLRYTQHLTFKSFKPCFDPRDLQEYLPQLQSITKLDSLTLDIFSLPLFTPVLNDGCFGTLANTLRHLDIRTVHGAQRALPYFISKFPLLEDLTIVSSAIHFFTHLGDPVPTITRSPPLRGKLVLVNAHSRSLPEGIAAFPGGLNFRSIELAACRHPEAVLVACGRTATSISYLWRWGHDSESNSLFRCIIRGNHWRLVTPLDLRRNVVLEKFEFTIAAIHFSLVHEWVYQTLQTITSPLFNEFVIWLLGWEVPRTPVNDDGWGAVETLLNVLTERNPGFRIVFVGHGDWSLIASYLPLAWSKGLVQFCFPHAENRFKKYGVM